MLYTLESIGRIETERVTPEQRSRILGHFQKYADVLGSDTLPEIKIRDSVISAKWLGRTLWTVHKPNQTIVELQRSILADDRTLERVIAHEMVHHVEMLEIYPSDVLLMKLGVKPRSHGQRFQTLAKKINEFVGDPEFVTITSDTSYAVASTKPYYLLIVQSKSGSFGFAYGVRLTPKMKAAITKWQEQRGARLVQTADVRWTGGPRIGEGGVGVPYKEEEQAMLKELWESAG